MSYYDIEGYIFIRNLIDLPYNVKGVTIPNVDGTFDVYVNANYTESEQRSIVEHEVKHIKLDHFYSLEEVLVNEKEAG